MLNSKWCLVLLLSSIDLSVVTNFSDYDRMKIKWLKHINGERQGTLNEFLIFAIRVTCSSKWMAHLVDCKTVCVSNSSVFSNDSNAYEFAHLFRNLR